MSKQTAIPAEMPKKLIAVYPRFFCKTRQATLRLWRNMRSCLISVIGFRLSPSQWFLEFLLSLYFIHSVLKDLTGLAIAALIDWRLTVRRAINNAAVPARGNTHHSMLILYAKSCNHLFIAHQP